MPQTGGDAQTGPGSVTLVIPMAGSGRRFREAGFDLPKPFIRINGRPMIEWVLESMAWPGADIVLIAQRADVAADPEAVAVIERHWPVRWALIDGLTEGTACTVLAAEAMIPASQPMLMTISDACIAGGVEALLADARERDLDGSLTVFEDWGDPKLSFARVGDDGLVTETAEKRPISHLASAGQYYAREPAAVFAGVREMLAADDRVNGEFYTCPVYNYMIRRGARVGACTIPSHALWAMNTPEDLAIFLRRLDDHGGRVLPERPRQQEGNDGHPGASRHLGQPRGAERSRRARVRTAGWRWNRNRPAGPQRRDRHITRHGGAGCADTG
ncbi:MAG: glycosyltransferase family 2 protein [Thermomicrobiales bacterium]